MIIFFLIFFEIKIATVAPEASDWADFIKEVAKKVEKETGVKIKGYFGVMGDEDELIKKMRLKQISGAGITTHGAEKIVPEVRAFDIPGVFKSYEEFDFAVRKLFPELQDIFRKAGYEILNWISIGFVYIFSAKERVKGTKIWLWGGDLLAEAEYKTAQKFVSPIFVGIQDVLTSLQTGLIDSVFSTPYVNISFQWAKYIKSFVPEPGYIYSGGIVVRKEEFEKIPEEKRKIVLDIVMSEGEKIQRKIRERDIESLEIMRKIGLKEVKSAEEIKEFREYMERVKEYVLKNERIKKFHDKIKEVLKERENIKERENKRENIR